MMRHNDGRGADDWDAHGYVPGSNDPTRISASTTPRPTRLNRKAPGICVTSISTGMANVRDPNVNAEYVPEPFHTLDSFGNEYVIEHGNVAIDAPTEVTLWPLSMWRAELDRRRAHIDGLVS